MRKMNFDDLLDLCDRLRYSQGFYGRLYEQLLEADEDEKKYNISQKMSEANLYSDLDIILWLEC